MRKLETIWQAAPRLEKSTYGNGIKKPLLISKKRFRDLVMNRRPAGESISILAVDRLTKKAKSYLQVMAWTRQGVTKVFCCRTYEPLT